MKIARLITRVIDRFYLRPVSLLLPLQTFRYGACGAINLVLGWVLYYAVLHYALRDRFIDLGWVVVSPYIAALCLVFPITFLTGFWLNRNVAFRRSPLSGTVQIVRYALSVAGALLLNYVSMKLLVEFCGLWATPSKIVTDGLTVAYSYLVAKYFTFRGCVE